MDPGGAPAPAWNADLGGTREPAARPGQRRGSDDRFAAGAVLEAAARRHGEDATAVDYEDFRVLVAQGPDGPVVRVLGSPAGERAREPFECSVSEGDLARLARVVEWSSGVSSGAVRRHLRPRDTFQSDSFLRELGERLYRCLFTGDVRVRFLQSRQLAPRGLRVRLQLDLEEVGGTGRAGTVPRGPYPVGLHRLPWELLREPGEGQVPLALRRGTPVVRYLEVEGPAALPPVPDPLVVLAVASEPQGVAPLGLDREVAALQEALGARRDVALRVLESPTLEALIEALRGGDVHALHFMGHGELDPDAGEGALVLEDAAGRARRLPARALVEQLGDFLPPLRLVFLNACRTAEAASGAPWAGVATALVRAGVPAVVAMQLPVTDRAAVTFAASVYRRLAEGDPLDTAVTDGRLALRRVDEGTPEWSTPALFLRVPDGRVFGPPARSLKRQAAWLAAGLVAVLLGAFLVFPRSAPVVAPGLSPGAAETEEVGGGGVGGPSEGPAPSEPSREPDGPEATAPAPLATDARGGPEDSGRSGEERHTGPAGTGGAAASALVELTFGESVHVREVRAHVTADSVTVQGEELVRVTVSPDGHASLARAGFPGSTLRFPAGEEVLTVHVLSLDRAAGTVRLRARRTGM